MLKGQAQRSLLGDPQYLRLWLSILISSFGNQVTMLALPLTAAGVQASVPLAWHGGGADQTGGGTLCAAG